MKKWLILLSTLLSTVLLLLSVAGCQTETKVKNISVGILADLTGPTGALGGIGYASRDYFIYYNEKYGGINGIPIESQLIDTAYELSKEVAGYKELINKLQPVSMHIWSTAGTKALRRDVNEIDKIPIVGETQTEEIVDPVNLPFNFISGPTYEDAAMIVMDWIKELGGKTVVFLTGPTEFHVSPTKQVLEQIKYQDKIGLKVLGWIQYQAKPTDVTAEMLRVKELNPDFIWVWDTPEGSIPVLRAASGLGIPSEKFIVSHWSRHPLVIEQVGAKGVEGVRAFKLMKSVDELIQERLPVGLEIEEFSSTHKLYTRNWEYVKGWIESKTIVEAINRAVKKNGNVVPEDIYRFRQMVRNEWEAIKGWDIGIGVEPIDYSDHKGWTSMVPMIARNGVWEVYGPARKIEK